MEERTRILAFGHAHGDPFRLEVRHTLGAVGLLHLTLFHGQQRIKVEKRALELLAYFLQHPLKELSEVEIGNSLWRQDASMGGNVEQQVHKLRLALSENAKSPRFIETIPKRGYKFLEKAVTEREVDELRSEHSSEITVSNAWKHEAFLQFLKNTTVGNEPDEVGDIRIVTTAFSGGVPDIIVDLLDRKVRINILLTNENLTIARNKVRTESSSQRGVALLKEQRETLEILKRRYGNGRLNVRESDVMPCGFIAHARHGALLGLFLATETYTRGPMIEIKDGTGLWKLLLSDWNALWGNSTSF